MLKRKECYVLFKCKYVKGFQDQCNKCNARAVCICVSILTQLEHRSPGLPPRQPDSDGPVFGVRDGAPALLAEQRQRAQRVCEEQVKAASSKRKEALCSRLSEQRKEMDMLQRNHQE